MPEAKTRTMSYNPDTRVLSIQTGAKLSLYRVTLCHKRDAQPPNQAPYYRFSLVKMDCLANEKDNQPYVACVLGHPIMLPVNCTCNAWKYQASCKHCSALLKLIELGGIG